MIPLSITFSRPKIFRFPFSMQNSLICRMIYENRECGKIKVQKIVGNLLDKRRKLYMNRTVI